MSCGCNDCGHNPCECDTCDANNEPLASALNNFIASFFGSISKTCVDNQVQWILPCDLNTGLPGFERRQGEGVACYLLRLFDYLQGLSAGISVSDEGVVVSSPATSLNFTGGGVTATGAGSDVTVNIPCTSFQDKIAINGVCYDTWQAAYDANASVAAPTLMLVGQGTSFGNLTLAANYNTNIIVSGFGASISQLGTITGNGFNIDIIGYDLTFGGFASAGATIVLGGTAIYGAINTTRLGGAGGPVTVRTKIRVGTITAVGSGAGGAVVLEREVVSGAINSGGVGGGSITLGDECTTGAISAKPLVGPSTGGTITIGDDCVTGAIDNSGTAANTAGGTTVIGDRCEVGTISTHGITGGGNLTIGEGLTSLDIDTRSTTSGNGGNLIISHRAVITGNIDTSGVTNAGSINIGANAFINGSVTGAGTNGTSGPVFLNDGSHYATLSVPAGTTAGAITIGKFCVIGTINANSNVTSGITIGDGTTVSGTVTLVGAGNTGNCTIGSSVTITGNFDNHSNGGTAGSVTVGRGCNLQDVRSYANASTGGITIGASTTALIILCNNGGGVGTTAGDAVIGAGASVTNVLANSFNPGGNSGSITMEPGSSAAFLTVASNTGTGGNIVLRNSNYISGASGAAIAMGSSNTGSLTAINPRILDQIDNVTSTTIIRDGIFSTPAANRDCIANVLANGAQFTNCLFVPNGTGFSITASAPRTIIGYQILHKNGFGPNVSLSEGSDTVSANLLAP